MAGLTEDKQRGKYVFRGAIQVQSGTTLQNLHQGTAIDLIPAEWEMSFTMSPSMTVGLLNDASSGSYIAEAITAHQAPNGDVTLRVSSQGAPLSFSAATAVSVGVADGAGIAANPLRRYVSFTNTTGAATISLSFNGAAVLGSGVTLMPGASYEMIEAQGNLYTGAVRVIASGAASNLSIQEAV